MKDIEQVKIQLLNNKIENIFEDFDINSYDNYGNNILHYFIKNSEAINVDTNTVLNLFLNKGLDINSLQTKSPKSSALHLAVKLKKRNIFELLLELNIKIDVVDEQGNTPLWQAVMGYRDDDPFYIQSLIAKGADKNIENKHGVSPLSLSNVIANYDSKSLMN